MNLHLIEPLVRELSAIVQGDSNTITRHRYFATIAAITCSNPTKETLYSLIVPSSAPPLNIQDLNPTNLSYLPPATLDRITFKILGQEPLNMRKLALKILAHAPASIDPAEVLKHYMLIADEKHETYTDTYYQYLIAASIVPPPANLPRVGSSCAAFSAPYGRRHKRAKASP